MNLFAQARKKHYLCSRKGEGYVRYILIVFGQNRRHFANLPNTLISTLRPLLDPYLTLTIARVWRGVQILIIVLFFLRCFVEEDGAIFICSQKGVLFAYMKKK